MHVDATNVVSYCAVLLAGLVAGLLFGTVVDHNQLKVLGPAPWVLARQNIDAVFSRMMPWMWNISLVLLAAAAYLNRGHARWLFGGAAVVLLAGIIVTLVIEVPINKQIASWTPETIPADWADLRERWLRFHTVRTAAAIASFAAALLALFQR